MPDEKTVLIRLDDVRKRFEELKNQKSRLAGEKDGYDKRLVELEKLCKEQYQCTIEEVPAIIEGLKKEAETATADAEEILGLREPKSPELPIKELKRLPTLPPAQPGFQVKRPLTGRPATPVAAEAEDDVP